MFYKQLISLIISAIMCLSCRAESSSSWSHCKLILNKRGSFLPITLRIPLVSISEHKLTNSEISTACIFLFLQTFLYTSCN